MFTKSIIEDEIISSFHKYVKESIKNIDSINNGLIFPANDSHIKTSDLLQSVILKKYISREIRNILHPMIIRSATQSETMSAASGESCYRIMLHTLDNGFRNNRALIQNSFMDTSKVASIFSQGRKKFNKGHFIDLINYTISDAESRFIVEKAIEIGGAKSTFIVSKSPLSKSAIINKSGFEFKCPVDLDFLLRKKSWHRANVKCLVIDGMIENISEIYHILEKAAEDKQPYVIFCRNIVPEVRSTILSNNQRGVTDIFPVSIGYDEKRINMLNDISVACNTSVISSITGDLISSAARRKLDEISSIDISRGKIVIRENLNDKAKNHIEYLEKRGSEEFHPEKRIEFLRRASCFKSEKVEIKIGTNLQKRLPGCYEMIDKFFRSLGASISTGVIRKREFKTILENAQKKGEISKREKIVLDDSFFKSSPVIPFSNIQTAISIANSTSTQILKTSGLIICD